MASLAAATIAFSSVLLKLPEISSTNTVSVGVVPRPIITLLAAIADSATRKLFSPISTPGTFPRAERLAEVRTDLSVQMPPACCVVRFTGSKAVFQLSRVWISASTFRIPCRGVLSARAGMPRLGIMENTMTKVSSAASIRLDKGCFCVISNNSFSKISLYFVKGLFHTCIIAQ